MRWSYRLMRGLVRAYLRLVHRLRVTGLENLPGEGPVVLCANHRSYLDPPLLGCAIPRAVHFMAKEELFRIPCLGPFIRAMGAFPVRRGLADRQAIRTALAHLEAGKVVGVFPEGRRTRHGAPVGTGQPGAALLALRTGAPVIPAAIVTSYRPFRPVEVRLGPPVDLSAWRGRERWSSEELRRISSEVILGAIADLLHREAGPGFGKTVGAGSR